MATAWFQVPYTLDTGYRAAGSIRRVCALDALSPDIAAVGGDWLDCEIAPLVSLVRVRATSALLNQIGLLYPQKSETEVIAAWVPRRARITWNGAQSKFEAVPFRTANTTPLRYLVAAIPENPLSIELQSLIGFWTAVGFGLGFKLSPDLIMTGALSGYPPIWGGGFPTNAVLDNFNRANEGPPPSTSWTNFIGSGSQVVSNAWAPSANSGDNGSYWNPQTFGPDCEVYMTGATLSTSYMDSYLRLADFGAGGDGYSCAINGSTQLATYYRLDNGVYTQLGSTMSIGGITDGIAFGGTATGFTIQHYIKRSGSNWTTSAPRFDSTYLAAGNIGVTGGLTTQRGDDFGGGAVQAIVRTNANRKQLYHWQEDEHFRALLDARSWF